MTVTATVSLEVAVRMREVACELGDRELLAMLRPFVHQRHDGEGRCTCSVELPVRIAALAQTVTALHHADTAAGRRLASVSGGGTGPDGPVATLSATLVTLLEQAWAFADQARAFRTESNTARQTRALAATFAEQQDPAAAVSAQVELVSGRGDPSAATISRLVDAASGTGDLPDTADHALATTIRRELDTGQLVPTVLLRSADRWPCAALLAATGTPVRPLNVPLVEADLPVTASRSFTDAGLAAPGPLPGPAAALLAAFVLDHEGPNVVLPRRLAVMAADAEALCPAPVLAAAT